ncbi:WXG100 family type VII secretion target [Amycolatopsis sp. H20-H5]|uniref:WXG100 family type VII secretion target n=1 Tax=Amycolatopsis sp. H20-H5 TaxID=3046309 RepID=UPI002DB65B5D|nr:WXG100 family type VII secretion target [Amycolatopsis sp. H20-H5]MEC3974305.1 WXG100 family type VII secretion target [Amycolatopsis sp. H20-H5]
MDQLTVDFAVLKRTAEAIAKHIDATEGNLDELDRIVTDLKSSWKGDAQDAFGTAATEWFSAARDLRDQLHWLRDVVITAHDNHAKAVHVNVTIWQGR